jgi:hypothetical protein
MVFRNKIVSRLTLVFLLWCGAVFPATVFALGAKIESVQMPAWVERAGVKIPAKSGMELNSGDVVNTGAGSRLLVRVDEGSTIKLGESARLDLASLQPSPIPQGVFEIAMNVVKGAFRFTTTALGEGRRRNVDVRIGSISAGIRGTDIWGSSSTEKDVLCLIDGKITAQRDGEPEFSMNDPLTYYIVPKNKPATNVKKVPQKQLATWAAETELLTGGGIMVEQGAWSVNLMSHNTRARADAAIQTLADAGYAVDIEPFQHENAEWYRVRINGFATREDAESFAASMDGQFGISKPWVAEIPLVQ